MATYFYTGKCKWAKVHEPDKTYKKYSIDVLLDMDQYEALKATKIKNTGKPEDGKMWVTFRCNEADGPVTVIIDDKPSTEMIGNGSEVTIKVDIDSFTSAKWGNITRSRLEAVKVDRLVKYDDKPKMAPPLPGTLKPRLMF